MSEEACGATTELPTGDTVTCNNHKPGWHVDQFHAVWPEQLEPDDLHCGVWGQKDTASGAIWVSCGKVPDHPGDVHYAHLGGMPTQFRAVEGYPQGT